jgi:hypothetical protein
MSKVARSAVLLYDLKDLVCLGAYDSLKHAVRRQKYSYGPVAQLQQIK